MSFHKYAPHKFGLCERIKQVRGASKRIRKQLDHELEFMNEVKLDPLDLENRVDDTIERISKILDELECYVKSLPELVTSL